MSSSNPTNSPKFCDKCGRSLDEGFKYCDSCGNPVRKATYINHLAKNERIGIGIIAVAVIVASILIFVNPVVPKISSSPSQTTDNSSTTAPSTAVTTTLAIVSVNPTAIIAPYQNLISLSGTGFKPGASVELGGESMDISGDIASNLVYVKYKGDFSPGVYDFTIINPNGQKFTLRHALNIEPAGQGLGQTVPELSSSQVTAKIKPSVVLIRTDQGCGSGMIVRSDGTILTDNHVVSDAGYINVYLSSGVSYPAFVVSENSYQDLALVKINASNLPTVQFGDSGDSSISLGESVLAFGYPLTCNQDQTLEVEPGIVTARRTIPNFGELIQTSARINPGDSGGPLVDQYGSVIGINEGILTVLNIDLNITGVAFAIPSNTMQSFIGSVQ